MKISQSVCYAIRATLHLAEVDDGRPVPCAKIAEAGDMPQRFLLQILRYLVQADILRSTRGADGGYRLIRPLDGITLLEVIDAVEGPYQACEVDGRTWTNAELLQGAFNDAASAARRVWEQIKLIDLKPPRSA
jgi:Rrf2 family protein